MLLLVILKLEMAGDDDLSSRIPLAATPRLRVVVGFAFSFGQDLPGARPQVPPVSGAQFPKAEVPNGSSQAKVPKREIQSESVAKKCDM